MKPPRTNCLLRPVHLSTSEEFVVVRMRMRMGLSFRVGCARADPAPQR